MKVLDKSSYEFLNFSKTKKYCIRKLKIFKTKI